MAMMAIVEVYPVGPSSIDARANGVLVSPMVSPQELAIFRWMVGQSLTSLPSNCNISWSVLLARAELVGPCHPPLGGSGSAGTQVVFIGSAISSCEKEKVRAIAASGVVRREFDRLKDGVEFTVNPRQAVNSIVINSIVTNSIVINSVFQHDIRSC